MQVAAPAKPLGSWGSGISFAQRLAEKERQAAAPAPVAAQPQVQFAGQVGVSSYGFNSNVSRC